jgi:hypothetical protein
MPLFGFGKSDKKKEQEKVSKTLEESRKKMAEYKG